MSKLINGKSLEKSLLEPSFLGQLSIGHLSAWTKVSWDNSLLDKCINTHKSPILENSLPRHHKGVWEKKAMHPLEAQSIGLVPGGDMNKTIKRRNYFFGLDFFIVEEEDCTLLFGLRTYISSGDIHWHAIQTFEVIFEHPLYFRRNNFLEMLECDKKSLSDPSVRSVFHYQVIYMENME